MVAGTVQGAVAGRHAGKDARLLVEAAAEVGLDLPVLTTVRDLHAAAVADGHARDDMAAVRLALT